MRIDDLKAWLLGAGTPLATAIAARTTGPVPLTAFVDAEIILRDYLDPTTLKELFLDPQPDEIDPGTNHVNWIKETVEAYVIVTRGATGVTMRDQAHQYIGALLDCLKNHPDYFGVESREGYNGVEGKEDTKGERARLIFRYEE